MIYFNDIRELIGNTPMLKLNNLGLNDDVKLFAKLEHFNPGGSVKDRIGVHMLQKAEEQGVLKPGATIIEATAGNTGLGIALAAINKGYRIIFVVPEKFSIEKQKLMAALGAEIINTPKDKGMKGAIEKADELILQIKDAISLKQFENPANPEIHYQATGPEIYNALDGQIDYIVAGAGSGGTFTGIMKYIKEQNPKIQGIIADPVGSTIGGGDEGCYSIEGIGNNFVPETLDINFADAFIKVSDNEALDMVKLIAKREGLIVGSSSGAAIVAALKLAKELESGNIVVILPDRGDRYFSKDIY